MTLTVLLEFDPFPFTVISSAEVIRGAPIIPKSIKRHDVRIVIFFVFLFIGI